MSPFADSDRTHISALQLETQRLGLASRGEHAAIERHLAGCGACQGLAESVRAAHREFASEVLPRTLPGLTARRARQRRRTAWTFSLVMVPAMAALLVVARSTGWWPGQPVEEPAYALKGGPALLVAVRREELVFRPHPDKPLRPGDLLAFSVQGVQSPFVLVASVDGAGQVNVYVPFDGQRSAPLPAAGEGGRVALEGSVILDGSPGPERIYAFFSTRPLEAAAVRAALAPVAAGGAPAIRRAVQVDVGAAQQATVLLEKSDR
jgi:hypothetical protein